MDSRLQKKFVKGIIHSAIFAAALHNPFTNRELTNMLWRVTDLHEATLAENILNIAFETAEQNHATKIFKVGLSLGELAGVEALTLSFDVLKKNTPADGAQLVIKRVPCHAVCNKCGKVFQLEHYNFFCPECDGILILQSGRELLVDYVDCE